MIRILSNTIFLVILMICCANLFKNVHNTSFKMKIKRKSNNKEIQVTPEDPQELMNIADNNIDVTENEEDVHDDGKDSIDIQNEMKVIQAYVDKKPGFRASCGKKKLNKIKKNIDKMRKQKEAKTNIKKDM